MSPHNLFSCFLFPLLSRQESRISQSDFLRTNQGVTTCQPPFFPQWVVANWVYTVYNHDALCVCVGEFFPLRAGAKWRKVFFLLFFPNMGPFFGGGWRKSWIMGGEWGVAWFLGNIIWFHFAPFLYAHFIIHTLVFNGIFTPGGKSNFKMLSFWDIDLFCRIEEVSNGIMVNQLNWNTSDKLKCFQFNHAYNIIKTIFQKKFDLLLISIYAFNQRYFKEVCRLSSFF